MKKTILFCAMFLGSLAIAQQAAPILGGDRDVHGCKGSAGYTYSQIRNNCVRVFEQKIKLKEVSPDKSSSSMTAVIFSKDMKRAEVFIPDGMAKSIILDKEGKAKIWKSGSHIKETYVLVPYKKSYQIKKDDVVIYQ
ncbi:hypothetical protein EGY07_06590 [Chryseobacterium indologenes]|uniref:hypothetical protein n=1 Tax=Chryseobacterium TaxID=59732 RepID=UPI0004880B47|nr:MULTISPECIES: hypothetical protein [Chryseobacterium]ASE61791.1 hypothetical protein CEQ15_09975 [Chryseobacterium indologenes]AYZ35261.1 hypothetical protein EGY07_06590 [Chryseobacterium indologenes]MBF6643996.1 hypothetical protein [Chryseobacterium indologenes]MBU3047220.1 hypothetical protein [Chryseobacterium indologenes]MEB4761407.1 hypothetical protein [Chryseobacterium indologenes]